MDQEGQVVPTLVNVDIVVERRPGWERPTFARYVSRKKGSRWDGMLFKIVSVGFTDHHHWEISTMEAAAAANWTNLVKAKALIVEVLFPGPQRVRVAEVLIGPMPPMLYKSDILGRWAIVQASINNGWSLVKKFTKAECPPWDRKPPYIEILRNAYLDPEARELFTCKGGDTWDIFSRWLLRRG